MSNEAWARDDLQFPRLIEEAQAAGAFTEEVMADMCESMDLTHGELVSLLDRARMQWERIKEGWAPPYVPYGQLNCALCKNLFNPREQPYEVIEGQFICCADNYTDKELAENLDVPVRTVALARGTITEDEE